MRPIDANALNRELAECCNINDPIFGIVRNCHTLDVAPVVHAHLYIDGEGYERCSNCNEHETGLRYFTFCPHCGAKLDGGADNGIDGN